MKIRIKITNSSKKRYTIKFEPSGEYQYLYENNDILVELERINIGLPIDLIIDDLESVTFVENNDVFIDKFD